MLQRMPKMLQKGLVWGCGNSFGIIYNKHGKAMKGNLLPLWQ